MAVHTGRWILGARWHHRHMRTQYLFFFRNAFNVINTLSAPTVRHCASHLHLPIQAGRPLWERPLPPGAQQTLSGHCHDPKATATAGQAHGAHSFPGGARRTRRGHQTGQHVLRHLDAAAILLCAASTATPERGDSLAVERVSLKNIVVKKKTRKHTKYYTTKDVMQTSSKFIRSKQ